MFVTRRYLAKLKHSEGMEERRFENVDKFVGLFFLFGTSLIIIPESLYIKDIYPTHFRANTMFKLGYSGVYDDVTCIYICALAH